MEIVENWVEGSVGEVADVLVRGFADDEKNEVICGESVLVGRGLEDLDLAVWLRR